MDDKCTQKHRWNSIESDIKELKEADKCHTNDISDLKESSAETKVYVKQILSKIEDLKEMFTERKNSNEKKEKDSNGEMLWAKHAAELVKLVVMIATLLAGVKYFKL